MLRHLKVCKRNDTRDIAQMLISTNTDNVSLRANWYESQKLCELFSKSILMHDLPFQFVEYTRIRALFNYLYLEVDTVSKNTAKADILKLYQREMTRIKAMLDVIPSRISLTSNLWSYVMSVGYMCLKAHFIDKNLNF